MLKLYTMVVAKLQHKWGQLALTIVKIRNSHSVVFRKIYPSKSHPNLKVHINKMGLFSIIKVGMRW